MRRFGFVVRRSAGAWRTERGLKMDSMDESIRLKKLCAAKDAQIEALYGRVEILTDDIAVLRGERAYLHEAAQSSKRECHTYEMRARRFEQDARAATLRADEAERALIASECSFAKDLDALRTLLRTSDDAQQQAANTDVETVSLISQIETLRAELRALDEASPYTARLAAAEASAATAAAQEQASAARAAAAVLVEENASLRVQLQEAVFFPQPEAQALVAVGLEDVVLVEPVEVRILAAFTGRAAPHL